MEGGPEGVSEGGPEAGQQTEAQIGEGGVEECFEGGPEADQHTEAQTNVGGLEGGGAALDGSWQLTWGNSCTGL